ncbi:hypothetical protein [Sorangium sp. So ce131]|uniref:hypothetical protein n=1 Tax=Sorangium sp. So ce131 TaxID=3133282 RepID=UPI003F63492F
MPIVRSTITLAALLAVFAPGCAVDATDFDPAVDALAEGAPAAEAEDWTIGTVTVNPTWDSGATANLAVRYVKCQVEYGPEYMLTGLDVYEGNVGQFIGRMRGQCRQYDLTDDTLPQGASGTKNFFLSGFQDTVLHAIDIPSIDAYPTGVTLTVNNASGHVKNINIQYAEKTTAGQAIASSSPLYTADALGYGGDEVLLSCEDQEVMTGMQLSYDTTNGHIRKLEIFCRTLDFI